MACSPVSLAHGIPRLRHLVCNQSMLCDVEADTFGAANGAPASGGFLDWSSLLWRLVAVVRRSRADLDGWPSALHSVCSRAALVSPQCCSQPFLRWAAGFPR